MDLFDDLRFRLNALTVYRSLLKDEVIDAMLFLLQNHISTPELAAEGYGKLVYLLDESPFGGNLADYIFDCVLYADNSFTRMSAKNAYITIPITVKNAVQQDINTLSMVASISSAQLKAHLCALFPDYKESIDMLPDYKHQNSKYRVSLPWGEEIGSFAKFCQNHGYSIFARAKSFYMATSNGAFTLRLAKPFNPISTSLPESCRANFRLIQDNTRAFVAGKPYEHMLMTGDNPLYKTIVFKRMIDECSDSGVRSIEMYDDDIPYLTGLVEMLSESTLRFILYIHVHRDLLGRLKYYCGKFGENVLIYLDVDHLEEGFYHSDIFPTNLTFESDDIENY